MKKIFISLAMALSIVSCSTEELSNGGGNDSQKGVVQLVLSTDGFDMMGSRAVDESAIHDINILEYIDGTLSQVVYLSGKDFSQAVEVSGLKDLPATTMTETTDANGNKVLVPNENNIENVIFVVANYGKEITNTEDVPYYKDLKKLTMSFSGKTDMTNLPMTGFYYGGINANSTTQMNVTLQRAVAKVNFTLDTSNFAVGGNAPNQLVVNNIKLCNVPGNITLYPCQDRPSLPINGATVEWNSENGHTPFPTKDEMEAEGGSVTYGDDENQSSTANTANTYTYVAYIPENVRGSYSNITENKDKRPSKCEDNITDDSKDKSYTYILVDLNYATSDGTAKNATYRIYLGGNKTGDMNLLRNTQYNITTFLYGANSADTRITIKDITPVDVVETENANCYMIDMSDMPNVDVSKKVTIPLQQVINGWNKISSTTAATVQSMLEFGNWEIQTEWRTWKDGSSITGTKSSDFSSSNLKATLAIPSAVKNGENAVVKLVSKADNKTYWSWHLWFTDYKPSATGNTAQNGQVHQYISNAFKSGGIYYGKYMMDRNLGATIIGISDAISQPTTTAEAVKYYGLMYQWGRKDPFPGSSNGQNGTSYVKRYDASGTAIDFKTEASSTTDSKLAYAVNNPLLFLTAANGNWTTENDLWDQSGTDKSVFDPCPPGWRIPIGGTDATKNPWAGFGDGNTSLTTHGNSNPNFAWQQSAIGISGRLYNNTTTNTKAWFPTSGYLMNKNKGYLDVVGLGGYCRSAIFGYFLSYGSYDVAPSDWSISDNANGFPVRCVQE